jgi:hypothetical protein
MRGAALASTGRASSRLGGSATSGAALGLIAALALLAAGAPAASADHAQLSVFQDDQYLLYASQKKVVRTVKELKALGVQELRVTVKWSAIAPSAYSRAQPSPYSFTPYNPSTYPYANWAPYDRIDELAHKYGLQLLFTITGPGPLWATANRPPTAVAATHWYLNATDFKEFVYAVGVRYSGSYFTIPAVTAWSVWNEPNQPGWLAPQEIKSHGRTVPVAPKLYREYVDAAWTGLVASGHTPAAGNQFLIGELAPEGDSATGPYIPMTPMPFLRDLYCVGGNWRPLTGAPASALGCPATAAAVARFTTAHPGLFQATGFAHHPYYFFERPSYSSPDRNYVPLANISRLEVGLQRVLGAYGDHTQMPIWFTEYGYQTKPPDPYQTVTPAEQATYLNEADYMSWRNPRILSVAQFELYDSPPNPAYKPNEFGYWDTFQTGLLFARGRPKPALAAYRLPVWIPGPRFRRGQRVFVWGQVRPASSGAAATAAIQWKGATGGYRTLATVTTTGTSGYFTAYVRPAGTGTVRTAWTSGRTTYTSRLVPVTQG